MNKIFPVSQYEVKVGCEVDVLWWLDEKQMFKRIKPVKFIYPRVMIHYKTQQTKESESDKKFQVVTTWYKVIK